MNTNDDYSDVEKVNVKIQAVSVPSLPRFYNYKNVKTQTSRNDPDLVQTDRRKGRNVQKEKPPETVPTITKRIRRSDFDISTTVFHTGIIRGDEFAITVDFNAYKTQLRLLKEFYEENGKHAEYDHIAVLLEAFQQRKILARGHLAKIYNSLGEVVVPLPVLQVLKGLVGYEIENQN